MRVLNGKMVLRAATVVLCMLLNVMPVMAQNDVEKTPGKSLREILHTADSLRLRLRNAADNGRMLQWIDSMVNARLDVMKMSDKRRERLKRKLTKIGGRLSKIDRRLFLGDSLLAVNYRKKNIDTAYVTRPDARWTIKFRGNLSGAMLETRSKTDGISNVTKLHSDYRGTLSVAVAYRGLALGLAVNPAKLAGRCKDYEFNVNSYGNRMGFDIVYLASNTYRGTRSVDGSVVGEFGKGQVSQQALNLNFYYAFNSRRFSFPAAFSQSYIQKRSAGSWMIGASFDGSRTDINADEASGVKPMKIRFNEFAVGAGYGYNFVAGRHLLFHLSALPTLTVYSHDYTKTDGVRSRMEYHFPSAVITGRGAALYYWRNKFAGATVVYNFSFAGEEQHLWLKRDKWRLRAFFGFRF